jgi:hypothetical protein
MLKVFLFALAAVAAFGADDPWAKVKEIKSGTELRVVRKGSAQPLLVKMDELTDENLLVVNKNAQLAIPRDQIDRIDSRAAKPHWVKETTNTVNSGEAKPPAPGSEGTAPAPTSSTSTGFSKGSRPDFETVYRRPAPAPRK